MPEGIPCLGLLVAVGEQAYGETAEDRRRRALEASLNGWARDEQV
jgi:hypothetical protein